MAPNWSNRTIFIGDNLPVLRGMNTDSVDLIYMDPPFNKGMVFKLGKNSFSDKWGAIEDLGLEGDLGIW